MCSVTVFQSLFMKGIKLTSPTMATAMPNLAPGLIFFIAWALRLMHTCLLIRFFNWGHLGMNWGHACRLERIEWGCMYSRAKVAGTLLCMLGAILMSVMQSAASVQSAREGIVKLLQSSSTDGLLDKDTMTGCVYLIAAVVVLSSQAVLQVTADTDHTHNMEYNKYVFWSNCRRSRFASSQHRYPCALWLRLSGWPRRRLLIWSRSTRGNSAGRRWRSRRWLPTPSW